MEKWDCYWSYGGKSIGDTKYFTEKFCRFNDEVPHKPCKICSRYVRRDKIDDYIRFLLEELEYYYKLP